MKNIFIKSILLFNLMLALSCAEEDYVAPYGDFSSFSWYTSDGFDTDQKFINIDKYVAFVDLSVNAIEHSWTIPESAKFLNKKFTQSDSIYDKFIIPFSGIVSTDNLVNVLFQGAGEHEVKLHNVYKDSVAEAVKVNGQWVVDKVFKVKVFANVNPSCRILHNGVEVFKLNADTFPTIENMSSWPKIDIEAGDALVFEDLTTIGEPTSREWNVGGGKPELSKLPQSTVLFNKLGEFTGSISGIRSGTGFPSNRVTKLIPVKINVIPSTKPFVFNGGLTFNAAGAITFNVTGEVDLMLAQESKFTVNVVNVAANFNKNIAVTSAKINSTDATKIELTLAEPTFNTDVITVKYTNGAITSVDSRNLVNFGPEIVSIPLGSSALVTSWAGFENPSTSGNQVRKANADGYWVGAGNDASQTYWLTDEKKFEGNYSMRYKSLGGVSSVTLQGSDFSKPSGISAGTYRVAYMIYLEPGNTMKAFQSALQDPFMLLDWDISTVARGKWVEVSQVITVASDIASGRRFDIKIEPAVNPGVTGDQIMYFDNLSWIKLVPRS